MANVHFPIKARFLGRAQVKDNEVSFFSPPHEEPDFLWVDLEELAKAFLSEDAAIRMVKHTHNFGMVNRPTTTAVRGDKIVTIVPHPMAQGFCAFIDHENGHVELDQDEWNVGPANLAYTRALAAAHEKFLPLGLEGLAATYRNQGGPQMRGGE
ncbi:hypothetical protein J2Y63_002923 [Shinella sp. BE166]|uniref:hypothetical protein n=1 Tax=Shinella sp. BE166 TaxID=3373918 RepID=UPI003EB787A8